MFQYRPNNARGSSNFGWLSSKHTFSFGRYHDPIHMGFRNLLVINEDRVIPNKGFGMHGHRNMEIISYVVSGSLAHRDSMNNGSTIRTGDVQRMSAGFGVKHSEFNQSDREDVHFLQIWIQPNKINLKPDYEERHFGERSNVLRLMVSGDIEDDALFINADVRLFGSVLDPNKSLSHKLTSGRHAWVQVISGSVTVSDALNKQTLSTGDGLGVSTSSLLTITAKSLTELLVFDLP